MKPAMQGLDQEFGTRLVTLELHAAALEFRRLRRQTDELAAAPRPVGQRSSLWPVACHS